MNETYRSHNVNYNPRKKHIELHSHPFYFAHYLNMARHNAYVILSTIAYELNFTEGGIEENNLHQLKLYNNKYWKNKPDELALRNDMLLSHFPFLRGIKDDSTPNNAYEKITDKLKDVLNLLNNLRDNFSHFPFDNRCISSVEFSPYFIMALKAYAFSPASFLKRNMHFSFWPAFMVLKTHVKINTGLHSKSLPKTVAGYHIQSSKVPISSLTF